MKTLVNNKGRIGRTNASTPLCASRTGDLSPPPGPRGPRLSPEPPVGGPRDRNQTLQVANGCPNRLRRPVHR